MVSDKDPIVARSSAPGRGGIGVVRISGTKEQVNIISQILFPQKELKPRYAHLLSFKDSDGHLIDRAIVIRYFGPASYTGEDVLEIQAHGGPALQQVILERCLQAGREIGLRTAEPGEFTKRAFLNGMLDLTEAEAVIDIIEAATAEAAVNAAGQLGGALSRRAEQVYSDVVDIISHFDAVLDYPDEDIEPFELANYASRLDAGAAELRELLASFERGRVMREGVRAAIVGRPNAGKSSLLNAILGYDRAIVTAQPGTTRDTIEEKALLGGVLLRLTDTAGLREAADEAEREGVRRAFAAAEGAELAIAVFDGSQPLSDADGETLAAARAAKRAVCVINKCDLPQVLDAAELTGFDAVVSLSARTGEGLDALAAAVAELFPAPAAPAGEILTNARQAEAVGRALSALDAARDALAAGLTPDAVLTEAEDALAALAELTGRSVRDDVTDRIFSRFCVGK